MSKFEWSRQIENGFERCVWCGIVFGAEDRNDDIRGEEYAPGIGGGVNYTHGPVIDKHGRKHDHVGASKPGSYLMHPNCFHDYQTEKRAEENQSLGEFA